MRRLRNALHEHRGGTGAADCHEPLAPQQLNYLFVNGATISADIKWQLLGSRRFALASGLGLSYLPISTSSSSSSGSTSVTLRFIELLVPLYFSLDFSESIGLYLVPKVSIISGSGSASSSGSSSSASSISKYAGSSIGLRIGNKVGVMAEFTLMRNLDSNINYQQIGGAIFFGNHSTVASETKNDRRTEETDIAPEDSGHVIKVYEKKLQVGVTHPTTKKWKVGDQVCVIQDAVEVACGKVLKTSSKYAIIKLKSFEGLPENGDEVRTESRTNDSQE